MADRPKEPQSYGSQEDWVTGNVDEEVNRLKGPPNSQHADFYSSHGESKEAAEDVPTQKVTDRPSGAKTDSYFKKRDFE